MHYWYIVLNQLMFSWSVGQWFGSILSSVSVSNVSTTCNLLLVLGAMFWLCHGQWICSRRKYCIRLVVYSEHDHCSG